MWLGKERWLKRGGGGKRKYCEGKCKRLWVENRPKTKTDTNKDSQGKGKGKK